MAKVLRILSATLFVTNICAFTLDLQIVSRLFLPYKYEPTATYGPLEDAAEQMAYDPETKLLYSVGHTNIHVINMSDVTSLEVLYHSSQDNVDVTDVEVCGGFVFVAHDNQTKREYGFIDVYRVYNAEKDTLEHVHQIIVGDLPDMIQLTSDCSKLIVALEAEPYDDDVTKSLIDNPGAVIIVSFSDTPAGPFSMTTLDFKQYDSRLEELESTGVRQIYKGNNNTFSNDVEPEYIALNKEETKAYISLQIIREAEPRVWSEKIHHQRELIQDPRSHTENNAIAVVDLVEERIENVYGLGFKNWDELLIDTSDKDDGINLRPRQVFGMYQPDSIKIYRHRGVDYVITANEGDSKDYKYYTEETRVQDYGLSDLFESNETIRNLLEADANLGRLKVTKTNGFNDTTQKFDKLYTYGGRSFSIWRADTMDKVYDSGSELARKVSLLNSNLFNNDIIPESVVASTLDERSDDKGLETESVVMGHFGYITLLFIGNERPGIVAVYSIDERLEEIKPRFETLLTDIPRANDTWQKLYDDRSLSMIDCEDMRFIPAEDSPDGRPLLVVSGSSSGTITVVHVDIQDLDEVYDNANNAQSIVMHMASMIMCSAVYLLKMVLS